MTRTLGTLLLVVALCPVALEGQAQQRVRLALSAGPTLNDLEVGSMLWIGAASVELRPTSLPFVLDTSLRYLTFTAAEREHYPLAEVSAQWEFGQGRTSAFLGGGVGLAWRIRSGDRNMNASTHGAAGIRARLGSKVGLRAEARMRSVEPLADFTLGLSWAP
jgi:hypothetical protein